MYDRSNVIFMSLRCPLFIIPGQVVHRLEFLDSNAGPDNAVSELPYSLSSYSR